MWSLHHQSRWCFKVKSIKTWCLQRFTANYLPSEGRMENQWWEVEDVSGLSLEVSKWVQRDKI